MSFTHQFKVLEVLLMKSGENKKEMMQRLKDKLIEDAKLEFLEQQKMKSELNETKEIKNWTLFSK
jgi:hypothetical protein